MKPSAFKVGLAVTLVAGLLLAVRAPSWHRLRTSLDSRIHDVMFHARGPRPPTGRVVVVDIDEDSLAEVGQWPWPRTVVAALVDRLAAEGPRVIGFDAVFAEPDRTSLGLAARRLEALTGQRLELPAESLDNDRVLADAIGRADVVLGYFFELLPEARAGQATETPTPLADDRLPCPERDIKAASIRDLLQRSRIPVARRATLNLACLNDQALSEGFFNTVPDGDGMTRRGSLFIRYGEVLYPSLPLEMVREGLGADFALASHTPTVGVTTLRLGEREVPVTQAGQLCLNFRGPPRTLPYVSAGAVLRGEIPPGLLKDAYVLIGTSAIGLLDLRATPFHAAFPGVEVNATVIDNLLAGDAMVYDMGLDLGLNVALVAVLGTLLAAGLAWLGPRAGALCGGLFLLAVVYGNYRLLFLQGRLVGLTYVVAALLAVFIAVSVANYFFEGRRKRFLQGAFSRYVSEDVVAAIVAHPERLSLEGEERELTILFSDIRGFTGISERLSARQLSAFLNEYLSAMTEVIMARGGTVDKFIGDAIMAFWGAPLADAGHAPHAVAAALAMRRLLAELQPRWAARGLPPIDIGIGLNSGVVSVGNMGSSTRFSYTVMGDAVNLASRLEGLTRVYDTGMLISDATRRAIGDAFHCRPIDVVCVKGKLEPAALFEPLCEGPPDAAMAAETGRFTEALEAYRRRDFDACRGLIEALQRDHPQCRLYALYRERLELFRQQPPPPEWDGVFTFTTKGHDE
ncbi:MAG: adenylate/guanylate cyclase domain-containing protein [Lentisphaerae bacterium]|nr:adenylate/guanylate cyclase domain-containing protein [Lentisphaerota bacterium]